MIKKYGNLSMRKMKGSRENSVKELYSKSFHRKLHRLLTAISVTVLVVFLSVYFGFQQALMQSINTLNSDFIQHVNSTASMVEGILQNFSAQIFNIHSVKKLRTYAEVTNADMIDGIRALNDFTASSSVIDSIYVYNGKQDYVYSTLSSGAVSDYAAQFVDQAAVEIMRNKTPDQRLKPIRRYSTSSSNSANQDMFSLLLFDVTSGSIADNVLMLNINSDWFSELYFGRNPEAYALILDASGAVISSSDSGRIPSERLIHQVMERIGQDHRQGDFVLKEENGERNLCFFTNMGNRDWYYVRMLPYEKYLTGLTRMQSSTYLMMVLAFIALMAGIVLAAIRVWMPFHYIRTSLSVMENTSGQKKDPVEQLNALISRTADSKRINDALRRMLRDSVLSGLLLGQEKEVGSIASEYDMSIRDGEPLIPIFVSTNRMEHLKEFVRARMPSSECVSVPDDHIVVLAQPADQAAVHNMCQEMVKTYPRWYVIAGRTVTDWNALPAAYDALCEMYHLRFLNEGKRVWFLEEHVPLEGTSLQAEQQSERVMEALRSGSDEAVEEAYGAFIAMLNGKTYQSVEFSLTHLAREVLKLYYEMFPDPLPAYKEARKEFIDSLSGVESLAEIHDYFNERFVRITDKIRQNRRDRQGQLLEEVQRMIQENYTDTAISLQMLADRFSMSPAYLVRLFRQTYGISVAERITSLRMEEAKRLLKDTDLKIKDFGPLIGVENIQYFFVQFKNATGMTPKQYRVWAREGASKDQLSQ